MAEIRMLRWMSGVTKLDRIRNERKVEEISKKVQESRLEWYIWVGIEKRRINVSKRVMKVPEKRRRGRPKRR